MIKKRFLSIFPIIVLSFGAPGCGFIHRLPEDPVIDYRCTSLSSVPIEFINAANRKAYAAWWLWARLAGWNP